MSGPLRILARTPGAMAERVRALLRERAGRLAQPEQFFDQRIERLLADTPQSFIAYRPEALARTLAATGTREDAAQLAALPPRTFLELAAPLPPSDYSLGKIGALRSLLQGEFPRARDYRRLDPNGYMMEAYPEFAGADQVPHLNVRPGASDEDPLRVWGHEGRHRNFAASQVWGDAPLAVQLRVTGDPAYDRLLRENALLSERAYDSDLDALYPQRVVNIPAERYAGGGTARRRTGAVTVAPPLLDDDFNAMRYYADPDPDPRLGPYPGMGTWPYSRRTRTFPSLDDGAWELEYFSEPDPVSIPWWRRAIERGRERRPYTIPVVSGIRG